MGSSCMILLKLNFAVAFLCVVNIIIGGRLVEATVSCNQVISNLSPCVSTVTNGGNPPPNCCAGVKNLKQLAYTRDDRQQVCRCLKSIINGFPVDANNVANAAALPAKCRVDLPYKIDPNVDCNTIN